MIDCDRIYLGRRFFFSSQHSILSSRLPTYPTRLLMASVCFAITVCCPQCWSGDPCTRHFSKAPGWGRLLLLGGGGRLNIHRSWDSTTMPAKNRATDILSDQDSWQLDAAAAKGVSRLCVNFALSSAQSWSSHQIQTTHLLQRIAPKNCCHTWIFSFLHMSLSVPLIHLSPHPEREEGRVSGKLWIKDWEPAGGRGDINLTVGGGRLFKSVTKEFKQAESYRI